MNWLDYTLLAILGYSTIRAAMRGLTREVIGIVASVAALLLGMWFYGLAGGYLLPYVGSERVAKLAGFALVFFGVLLLGALVGRILARLLRIVGLSFLDRLGGACFGLARGFLFAIALLTAFIAFGPHADSGAAPASVVHSQIAPYVLKASNIAVEMAPMELKQSFLKYYSRVKSEIEGLALRRGTEKT